VALPLAYLCIIKLLEWQLYLKRRNIMRIPSVARLYWLLTLAIFGLNGLYGQDAVVGKFLDLHAGDYPKADLVVVFDSAKVEVQESGLSYVNFHRLYKVLTAKGAQNLRVIKMDYDPLSAFVDIKAVRIIRAGGFTEELDVSKALDYPAPARAIYWGAREKALEVGRLEPGDGVEVHLFRKGFTYALLQDQEDDQKYIPPMRGHFYDIVEFWSADPTLEKTYQVELPKSKSLQYQVYNGELTSAVHNCGERMRFTFTKKNIQPFKQETDMVALSDEAPKLLLSTSPDWYAKSKWFYGVNEDFGSFEVTPEVQQKVDEILQDAKTEEDKIYRLTHWVADEIRYSGLTMGPGEGFTLHKGSMTYCDRCGVCKDKAGMLITMLRAAGFESYAAMTMAGSRIDYIPADQFNHSVTIVKRSTGEYQILDPTWVPFVRELWSSAEQQQQYLMGLPQGADLKTTPLSPPENHYYRINGKSEIDADGTLNGQFTLQAEGQSDAAFRRMFMRIFKSQRFAWLQTELMRTFPSIEFKEIKYDDPADYRNPFKLTIAYRIPDYAIVTDSVIIFTPFTAANLFNSPALNDHLFKKTELEKRQRQFRTRCSKLIELNETVKLPKYAKALFLPKADAVSGSGADFKGGFEIKGRALKVSETITFKKRIYDPEDWPSYRQAVLAQKKLAEERIVLQK
jgi:hypothetical protein